MPSRLQGAVTTRYLSPSNPLVRFSLHHVLSDGISFLDIGAGVGVASALAARTPSVRITAIELDALLNTFCAPIWTTSALRFLCSYTASSSA